MLVIELRCYKEILNFGTMITCISILLQSMGRLRRELEELQRDEKDRQETELKAIRERQKAVEDLERGVSLSQFHLNVYLNFWIFVYCHRTKSRAKFPTND